MNNAQLVYGVEAVAYATPAASITRGLEFKSEALRAGAEHLRSAGLRPGMSVPLLAHRVLGKKSGSGPVIHELSDRGMAFLFGHMLGLLTPSQPAVGESPTVFDYTATIGTLVGKSLTCQVGRESDDLAVNPFEYYGLKVKSWKISGETGGIVLLELNYDIADFSTAEGLVDPVTYPASQQLLLIAGASLTFDTVAYPFGSFVLSGDTGLKLDRYYTGGFVKSEPKAEKEYTVTLEIDGEFIDMDAQDRLDSGEAAAVEINIVGGVIEDAYTYGLTITIPSMTTEGEQPTVGGYGRLDQKISMEMVDDGIAAEPITMVYRTSDATA